jgi:hypothetical protein
MDRIPDEAIVVRGGRSLPEDLELGIRKHPSGVVGQSVQCGVEIPLQQLAAYIPHKQVGVTTVGRIREVGGDVIRTYSPRSPYHATITGIAAADLSVLLTPTIRNPAQEN